jgi:hypothetical protein
MRQGAAAFHDLPAEQFNIDHVVVATEGVFAFETKGFTKPAGSWIAPDAGGFGCSAARSWPAC